MGQLRLVLDHQRRTHGIEIKAKGIVVAAITITDQRPLAATFGGGLNDRLGAGPGTLPRDFLAVNVTLPGAAVTLGARHQFGNRKVELFQIGKRIAVLVKHQEVDHDRVLNADLGNINLQGRGDWARATARWPGFTRRPRWPGSASRPRRAGVAVTPEQTKQQQSANHHTPKAGAPRWVRIHDPSPVLILMEPW